MSVINHLESVQAAHRTDTSKVFRNLYYGRAAFSILWAILVFTFAKTNPAIANALFIVYPAWDAIANIFDSKIDRTAASKSLQYVNVGISILTTIGIVLALPKGVLWALIVFGAWAILAGLIQLFLGLRRRKLLGGQWPMIISGGQSIVAGSSFIILASSPTMGIASLAGYAAFGAFYFLISAIRLSIGTPKSQ